MAPLPTRLWFSRCRQARGNQNAFRRVTSFFDKERPGVRTFSGGAGSSVEKTVFLTGASSNREANPHEGQDNNSVEPIDVGK
jgi:hypothetical protein